MERSIWEAETDVQDEYNNIETTLMGVIRMEIKTVDKLKSKTKQLIEKRKLSKKISGPLWAK